MSGIKGQKWADSKRKTPKIKCNVALPKKVYAKVLKMSNKKEWSISKTIEKIVTESTTPPNADSKTEDDK